MIWIEELESCDLNMKTLVLGTCTILKSFRFDNSELKSYVLKFKKNQERGGDNKGKHGRNEEDYVKIFWEILWKHGKDEDSYFNFLYNIKYNYESY